MSALPIDRPGKIVCVGLNYLCVGLNYRDHAEEQGTEPDDTIGTDSIPTNHAGTCFLS